MTVRELINALLNYGMEEEIEIIDSKSDELYTIVNFGTYSDLPYIEIKKNK